MLALLMSGFWMMSNCLYAVEGYEDLYLDREQTIYIHGIVCGDFKNPRSLKPTGVYSNSPKITKGTYYFGSKYGNFSYTFNPIEGQPEQVMVRGLLQEGQTKKEQMKADNCIVGKVAGLPASITKSLSTTILKANDAKWDTTMEQYAMVTGRPAFSPGIYVNPRATGKFQAHDQKVYDANQAKIKVLEQAFLKKSDAIAKGIPAKFKKADRYALQEDGFLQKKKYPVIKEPKVLTATAEKRYKEKLRKQHNERAWDIEIQKNFDWYFGVVGKGNKLVSTKLLSKSAPTWLQADHSLQRVVTVAAKYKSGKTLELDFLVTSSKVDAEVFESLETIQKKSNAARESMIVSAKKPRKIVKANANGLKVYAEVKKEHLFFSLFKAKEAKDTYRFK